MAVDISVDIAGLDMAQEEEDEGDGDSCFDPHLTSLVLLPSEKARRRRLTPPRDYEGRPSLIPLGFFAVSGCGVFTLIVKKPGKEMYV